MFIASELRRGRGNVENITSRLAGIPYHARIPNYIKHFYILTLAPAKTPSPGYKSLAYKPILKQSTLTAL